jgi:hypothetical protein
MKKYLLSLTLLLLSLSINAQAPQGFNYQATVRNASGDLVVNQNVYFKFNIIQGSQTAIPLYVEEHYVPTDDLGQVSLVIGQGTASNGIFSELDWSIGNYFLGIELNTGSGYTALGTTQFLSVPYALYAESSGSGGGSNLPDGINYGDTLIWNPSTNSWVVNYTGTCQIQLETLEPTGLGNGAGTLNGIITFSENCTAPQINWYGFVHSSVTQTPTFPDSQVFSQNFDWEIGDLLSLNISGGLNSGTTYYYRVFAMTGSQTEGNEEYFYGNVISYTAP